ncbi:hypothetical protein JCM5296_004628 [Sporobolomyces johnsonii]
MSSMTSAFSRYAPRRLPRKRATPTPLLLSLLLLALPLRPVSAASSSASNPPASTSSVSGNLSRVAALVSIFSVLPTPSTSSGNGTATATATAAWQTATSGAMASFENDEDTIVLPDDNRITYNCPKTSDIWQQATLTDNLEARTATGEGCYMEFTFQGDSVQIYGATGTDAGVFGCSVNTANWNATGWWNANAQANYFRPYQGSCSIQGLGFDTHTVQLVNTPYQPATVYFTGLRYTTNQTQTPWASYAWDGCCDAYNFPSNIPTTVTDAGTASATSAANATTSASGTSNEVISGFSNGTAAMIICGIAGVIIVAALLVGCMCCRRRPASGQNPRKTLQAALKGTDDDEEGSARPLRRRSSSSSHRRSHNNDDETTSETGTDTGTETETETSTDDTGDEKPRRRRK